MIGIPDQKQQILLRFLAHLLRYFRLQSKGTEIPKILIAFFDLEICAGMKKKDLHTKDSSGFLLQI